MPRYRRRPKDHAMTTTAQIIALAESHGWTGKLATRDNPVEKGGMRLPNYWNEDGIMAWIHRNQPGVYAVLPAYDRDLNALHEVEKTLTRNQHDIFAWNLCKVTEPGERWPKVPDFGTQRMDCSTRIISAPASQRLRALLMVYGKWDDSK